MADPNDPRSAGWPAPDPALADALRAHGFEASPPAVDVADEPSAGWSVAAGSAGWDGTSGGVDRTSAGAGPGDWHPGAAAGGPEEMAGGPDVAVAAGAAAWWVDPSPGGAIDDAPLTRSRAQSGAALSPAGGVPPAVTTTIVQPRTIAAQPASPIARSGVAASGPTPPAFLAGRIGRTATVEDTDPGDRFEPSPDVEAGLRELAAFAAAGAGDAPMDDDPRATIEWPEARPINDEQWRDLLPVAPAAGAWAQPEMARAETSEPEATEPQTTDPGVTEPQVGAGAPLVDPWADVRFSADDAAPRDHEVATDPAPTAEDPLTAEPPGSWTDPAAADGAVATAVQQDVQGQEQEQELDELRLQATAWFAIDRATDGDLAASAEDGPTPAPAEGTAAIDPREAGPEHEVWDLTPEVPSPLASDEAARHPLDHPAAWPAPEPGDVPSSTTSTTDAWGQPTDAPWAPSPWDPQPVVAPEPVVAPDSVVAPEPWAAPIEDAPGVEYVGYVDRPAVEAIHASPASAPEPPYVPEPPFAPEPWSAPDPQSAQPEPPAPTAGPVEPTALQPPATHAPAMTAPAVISAEPQVAWTVDPSVAPEPLATPQQHPAAAPSSAWSPPRGSIRDIGRRPPGAPAAAAGAASLAAAGDERVPAPDPTAATGARMSATGGDLWDLVTASPETSPAPGPRPVSRLATVLLTLLVVFVIGALVLGFLWSFTDLLGG